MQSVEAVALALALALVVDAPAAAAQPEPDEAAASASRVDVQPAARDHQIAARLTEILTATGWFPAAEVAVKEGVVFVRGVADTAEHRLWAGDLARRTQDVVAVVNQLEVDTPSALDFAPAGNNVRELGRGAIGAMPMVVFGVIVLGLGWFVARLVMALTRRALASRTERLTNRATVLLALDGNHIQIPNSSVYKSVIRNFSSTPNRREDFVVGIGYDDSIVEAQNVALRVLAAHPSVLADPEPWVLVESLGAATVHLRIYFWLDGTKNSWLKVRSSVIRLVKRAFQAANISMPDEARELVFPAGVPVHLIRDDATSAPDAGASPPLARPSRGRAAEPDEACTPAEGGLESQADELRQQARKGHSPESGADLLTGSPPT